VWLRVTAGRATATSVGGPPSRCARWVRGADVATRRSAGSLFCAAPVCRAESDTPPVWPVPPTATSGVRGAVRRGVRVPVRQTVGGRRSGRGGACGGSLGGEGDGARVVACWGPLASTVTASAGRCVPRRRLWGRLLTPLRLYRRAVGVGGASSDTRVVDWCRPSQRSVCEQSRCGRRRL